MIARSVLSIEHRSIAAMFEKYFSRPHVLARLRANAFVGELEALVEYLEHRGHRVGAIRGYVIAAAYLAECIEKKRVSLDAMSADRLQQFAKTLATHHRCGCRRKWVHRNLVSVARHFYVVLRQRGRCRPPLATPLPVSPLDVLLTQFDLHLRDERGLADVTRRRYVFELRRVLAKKYGKRAVDPSTITVEEVRRWVARVAATSPSAARALAGALRSLLRFLILRGEPLDHLVGSIPVPSRPRLSGMPGDLSDDQLARLVVSLDSSKAIGLRTRAMIECAATLGLRAGEIAGLKLSDVDWRHGTIHLPKTKSRRAQALPLPQAVGRALVSYVKRGRPKSSSDRLFVRHYMPVGEPLRSKDVTSSMRRAMLRADLRVTRPGAHVLRHAAASRLVRAGASIKDIADVLRHRDIDTTRIYAKVDWPRLQEIALPWPGAR
jgi:integrase/recombinase XerD